jgi:hypothetical protein
VDGFDQDECTCQCDSGSPADLGKLIGQDVEKWAKVIKFADIKPD